MLPGDVVLREATADNFSALIDALHHAMNWSGVERFSAADILAEPHLAGYVTGWPRPGDFGVVASAGGRAVGAAWCRSFTGENPGYGYVADDVPEVSMGVAVAWRGRGVGTALLTELVQQARTRGFRRLCLSVEDGNRARHLYERTGFEAVGREGGSDVMVLTLLPDLEPARESSHGCRQHGCGTTTGPPPRPHTPCGDESSHGCRQHGCGTTTGPAPTAAHPVRR